MSYIWIGGSICIFNITIVFCNMMIPSLSKNHIKKKKDQMPFIIWRELTPSPIHACRLLHFKTCYLVDIVNRSEFLVICTRKRQSSEQTINGTEQNCFIFQGESVLNLFFLFEKRAGAAMPLKKKEDIFT